MKATILAIYDSKAEAYLQPFFAQNQACGQRIFAHACNNPEQNFSQFPADYTLFRLGEFEADTGIFELVTPENLGNGLTYSKFEENPAVKLVGVDNA